MWWIIQFTEYSELHLSRINDVLLAECFGCLEKEPKSRGVPVE